MQNVNVVKSIMKKLLGIIVRGLLLSGNAYAELPEYDTMNGPQINREFRNKTLYGYYIDNKISFSETYNSNKSYIFTSEGKTSTGKWKIKRNKVCIKYDDMNDYGCVKVLKNFKKGKTYYFFADDNGVFAGASVIESEKKSTKQVETSKDIILKCSNTTNGNKSIIINESQNKIIFDGYRVRTKIIWGNKVEFMSPDPNVKSKYSNHTEVSLDRITGELNAPNWPSEMERLFVPRFQCKKVKALF